MSANTAQEPLAKILADLRSRNDELRLRAANDLRDHVTAVARELSGESFTRFINDVNRRIFELIHSTDNNDKIGGILAIDKLIEFDGEENTTKVTRFANYLRIVLPGTDPQITVLATKALGRLALSGGTLTAEFVEFEVKRALEWLQGDRHEARRYAAVLVLKELAVSAPTLIYSFVGQILDLIWGALRDTRVVIREGAAEALSATLSLVQVRDSRQRKQWYQKILEETQRGFKAGTADAIHGSLLILKELIAQPGMYPPDKFKGLCESVLKYKDHRDALVRRTVIMMIPDLAQFDPVDFVGTYLNGCMVYLLSQLKKDRDRSFDFYVLHHRGTNYRLFHTYRMHLAFLAIGKVAIAVGSSIGPYLDGALQNIKDGLNSKGRNRASSSEAQVFQCISMLAQAVGPALTKYMHELLEQMFASGLSEPLRQALVDLSVYIPPLLTTIQDRLLNLLSVILCGQPYRHPGSPARTIQAPIPPPLRDFQSATNEPRDVENTILALSTLGSFDFTGYMLHELIRDCAVSYLEDDNIDIRKAAALTCCHLLARDPVCYQTSNHAMQVVSEVLEKLLTVGITDPDALIRQAVLSSLDERFDFHLAQADHIRTLFIALNDEVFIIRELAISIIGRLTVHNPAYVLPSLRKTLIQLLTELEYSGASRQREESARLLGHLIAAAQRLIRPYVQPILKVLLPKARDTNSAVASQVLTAIGELAQVGGESLLPFLDELMPIVMETLQDQSSPTKREAALHTLGQLCSNTGWVIEPYLRFPNLLGVLVDILKTEQCLTIRRETVKVMGIIGALDPYKHKITSRDPERVLGGQGEEVSSSTAGSPSSEDYYPTVAVSALMKILRDSSLSIHHTAVIQAVMYIFKTLSLKCVPFLPQIMPPFLSMMRACPIGMLEFHFQQLGLLVSIVKQHIRGYLQDLLSLIQEYWSPTSNIQITILSLVEAIAVALDGEFKVYLPILLPQMLQIFEADTTEKRQLTQKVLHAMITFGSNLEEYLHLVVPVIVRQFEKADAPTHLKRHAIQTIGYLCKKINFTDQASRIIHPLVRVLAIPQPELRLAAMDTLCALIYQLVNDFAIFVPLINKSLVRHHIQHQKYEMLVSKLLKNEPLPQELGTESEDRFNETLTEDAPADIASKKLPVNQQQLKKAWETSQRSTKDDWAEWIRRFSVELLKESPSHALRACASLAGVYYPLARELFNASFVSCWSELYDQFQDELVRCLETALTSSNIPPEILQTLLNLAEFMEHDDKALPIDIRTLGLYAAKCHAYAKALHYKELEFIAEPLTNTIEALISINNQLQQPDSAIGILTYAQQNHDVELKESWYEKLHRWEDGLAAYEKKQAEDPLAVEATLGRMRCLHNLGEWDALSYLAQERWAFATSDVRKAVAPLAAAAAWGLGQWELMDEYIAVMKQESPDSVFFRAILALHRNLYPQASQFINKARDLLNTELMALVSESYSRAYNVVVRIQMLAELEEIITYKQLYEQPHRQAAIRKTWMARLRGCQRNVEVWQRILKVRALVISPKEDMEMWIKFANLCRKSGRLGLSQKTLTGLLKVETKDFGSLAIGDDAPQVIYACLKHHWTSGMKEQAFVTMKDFTKSIVERLGLTTLHDIHAHVDCHNGDAVKLEPVRLLARCYLKLGEWQSALQEELNEGVIPEILRSYLAATHCDKDWYKAWHAWAFANFEVISHYEKVHDSIPPQILVAHVVPSVQGFFRSIALSKGNSLQDTLRLLTLWFKYGYQPDVNIAIGEGFNSVSIDTWLQVIPQLIARIHTPNSHVRRLIHQLLSDVGKEHPQALVYSLTVASKSQSVSRKKSALAIIEKMRLHSALLVEQALLVSQELIRVAILWHEMWHEGLEEASRLYFGDHNVEGMFTTLEPLHQMLERGPETLREISFNQAFGRDLQEALDWCKRFKRTQNVIDINQAWDLYYLVFRRINKQLPQLTTLELQYVSPKLLAARDLELAVPGTYRSSEPIVKIASFVPTLTVMTSKQRPRRLTIRGSDGKDYQYLLKGHEDLRQDERVMQLFGLVNTLLATGAETFKRHLSIHRYPVIPLSPNSGLIGWVPHCDTLHTLIRDYRESRKILLNIEHRLMLQMAPDYDNLTLLQKVEVFEYALENTTGQDLYKVLWLKSKNSEVWLDRRTNYTRSLAVMSMVGYILGLGDRHPSNLMLDRFTGKVIHIDFGDCFEVAMHREKFPEKIPFRLTRMLINAMEVSGIEGNFRITCEHVMSVLRENKDSLMAVLEAFVYDPLINWRLLSTASPKPDSKPMRQTKLENDLLDEPVPTRNFPASRKLQRNENDLIANEDDQVGKPEALNTRALSVINRVSNKLTGKDFKAQQTLDVRNQVHRLILQATSLENLCQCYIGWCAFW
ncbi:armadillo-type protein [Phlyctochytrium arcticum]|nr:armadillo-type protein [Phlyctochytrium arcticum]